MTAFQCRPLSLFTILVTALALTGCGGSGGDSDSSSSSGSSGDGTGKKLFASTCGSCHTLADAGTAGMVGPNLDEAKPDEAKVASMIENGGGAMPPGLLEGTEAAAVAAYVAQNAGS